MVRGHQTCEASVAEKRRGERHLTLRTGKIIAANEASAFECAILNISARGACILVPDGAKAPTTFTLLIDGEAESQSCKLAWREGPRIGVSFYLKRSGE
jgi:PilZ domain